MKTKVKLRKYQQEGVKRLANMYAVNKTCLLADEMGLGKTIQALELIRRLLAKNKKAKVLVIAPAVLVTSNNSKWFTETRRYLPNVVIDVIQTSKQRLNPRASVYITSYALGRSDNIKDQFNSLGDLTFAVIDEAHNLKNYKSQQSKYYTSPLFKSRFKKILLMSGTVFSNSIDEMYTILRNYYMKGLRGVEKRVQFGVMYSQHATQGYGGSMVYRGLRNQEDLRRRLSGFMVRRLKEHVLTELPPLQVTCYKPTHCPAEIRKVLAKEEAILNSMESVGLSINDLDNQEKLLKFSWSDIDFRDMMSLRRVIGSSKIKFCYSMLEDILAEKEKVIVTCQFKNTVKTFNEFLTKKKIGSTMITGSLQVDKRMRAIDKFIKNDDRVMICTMRSISEGLDLVFTDLIVMLELDYSYEKFTQMCARIHRIGQKSKSVEVRYLAYNTGIDRAIHSSI